ncbi:MAG TPA: Spx/MgsR family RNA polymerase-binding regulatory protein [Xanthomonadales bacterium]|nr:Spx/MgsR family RNA polymerase-binding regulatory protein [Xanthomonadales bacterium]
MPVKQTDLLLVFGLKNCDSCSKARAWLDEHGVDYEFRDLRADGLGADRLKRWLSSPLAPLLTNRRSTTWRQLTAIEKAQSDEDPFTILNQYSTLIKRPVLERHGRVLLVGFSVEEFREHLLS